MDQSNKKEPDILHGLDIFKNPHLTITSVCVEKTKTASTSEETKNNSKRSSSNLISYRSTKVAKYSSARAITKRENNLCTISSKPNPVGSRKLTENNVIVCGMHADPSIPSKSYSEVQAIDESKTTIEDNKPCSCRWVEVPNCKAKKPADKKFYSYSISDTDLSVEEISQTPVGVYDDENLVHIRIENTTIYSSSSNELSQILNRALKQIIGSKELNILNSEHKAIQTPTFDCSHKTKNVASTSSNLRPSNDNITYNSNQSNEVEISKLKSQKINQPSKQTIEPPNISAQKPTSSNQSSKLKQSTNKKSVQKHHTSNNQLTNTSLKHLTATATHSQTPNKHIIITGNQLPMSSKHSMIVPSSKKTINQLPSVKPKNSYELDRGGKLCMKCRVVSKTDVCAKCMTLSLKNVTVTRIQLPTNIAAKRPTITLKPTASSSSNINDDPIDLCKSGDEDETETVPFINFEIFQKKHIHIYNTIDNITLLSDSADRKLSTLKLGDYLLLSSGQFFNDRLIEFYLNYWFSYKLSNEDRNRSVVFDTYFYNHLTSPIKPTEVGSTLSPSAIRFNRVKRYTKRQNVNVFQKDFIFIPIHEKNHWFLVVICFPHLSGKVDIKNGTPLQTPDEQPNSSYKQQQCDFINSERFEADPNIENLWLFDSNTTQNYFEKHGHSYAEDVANLKKKKHRLAKQPCIIIFDSLSGGVHRARVTATIRDWLNHEYCARYNDRSLDFSPKSMIGALVKVPQQPNYTECGLFLLHYFEMFFKRPIVDYSFPIYHLENWFSVGDISTDFKKRREIRELILTMMDELNIKLPQGIQLPTFECMGSLTDPKKHDINPPYLISDDEETNVNERGRNINNIENKGEGLGNDCDDEAFNEYHHMHPNKGRIVVDVENLRSELANHTNLINNQNIRYENYQSSAPNNHTPYRNDEDDDIKIEDDDFEDNEEDFIDPNSTKYPTLHRDDDVNDIDNDDDDFENEDIDNYDDDFENNEEGYIDPNSTTYHTLYRNDDDDNDDDIKVEVIEDDDDEDIEDDIDNDDDIKVEVIEDDDDEDIEDDIDNDDIKVEVIEDDDDEDSGEDYNESNSTTYHYRHNNYDH